MYLGADPELFLRRKSDQRIVAASEAGLLNGKNDPAMRWNSGEIQVYRDGYGMEVNFDRPYLCRGLMGNRFRDGLAQIMNGYFLNNAYDLDTTPAVEVSLEEIAKLPPDAAMFGCAPSKNAWGEKLDISEVDGRTHPWRYVGGHVWVSNIYDECPWLETDEGVEKYIRAMDYYLGVPFTYIFDRPEAYIRRKMYGRAGDYRTKQFAERMKGVEYRTLSPEWFNHTAWFSFTLGIARFLATRMAYIDHGAIAERQGQIQAAINEGKDLEAALPARLYGFYTKETLLACRENKRRFEFNFLGCPDTHSGWEVWSKDWNLPGDWAAGSSIDFKLAA